MTEDQYHNKQWGVDDFVRYHSQQMTNEERHALEKAALDDPFLEDALEGYAFASTPVKNIAELKEKLQLKKENTKVVVLPAHRSNQFLKVAAILLVFAGLTWLLYPGSKKPSTELATVTNRATAPKYKTDTAADAAAISPAEQAVAANETGPLGSGDNPAKTIISETEKSTSRTEVKENKIRNIDLATKTSEDKEMVSRQEKSALPALSETNMNKAVPSNLIKGKVVDNQGAPIPYATVTVPQNNTNVASDVNGVFFLRNNPETKVLAHVNAPGFETANAPLTAGADDNKIVLQESPQALSEVVIIGYGQTRKKSVTTAGTQIKADDLNRLTLSNVRPLGPDTNFIDAVKQLSANFNTDTTGYVLLNFDVDASGKARNIMISKSLCSNCDKLAIQLLQQVPALRRTNKNKPVARISF